MSSAQLKLRKVTVTRQNDKKVEVLSGICKGVDGYFLELQLLGDEKRVLWIPHSQLILVEDYIEPGESAKLLAEDATRPRRGLKA